MEIVIVDSDLAIQEYYRNLLESEFRNVRVKFFTSAQPALEFLNVNACDLVLTESRLDDMNFFEFLESLVNKRIPTVVVASDSSERFIVEVLRIGAVDFISKRNIKLGHLPSIIMRALLEADRWQKMHDHSNTLEHRPEFLKINQRIRSFLKDEQVEQDRGLISRGILPDKQSILNEGETYYVIYVFVHMFIPPAVETSMDERRLGEIRNVVMNKIVEIPPRFGGRLWTRKDDGCFFAFIGDGHVQATLSAIEIRAAMNLINLSIEHLSEKLCASIGVSAGRTVYRENKGELYSEALNLSAHMAYTDPRSMNILITSEIYDNLWSRAKKYFFRTDPFEGQTAYRFESIA